MKLSGKQKKNLIRILCAAGLLLLLGVVSGVGWLPSRPLFRLPFFLIPYFLVGWDVLWKAVRGACNGQLLDENFLMSIATVGAFVLGECFESVFVMLFYQVGELFQSIAVGKSRRSIAALMDIRPDTARVLRGGVECMVDPEEVSVGELLVIRPGERIALDGVVTEGRSELNTLSLTGEAIPRDVRVGDEVQNGCINVSGVLQVRVTRVYGESTVSRILELVENSALVKSKAENAVTRFAHWYTPLVVVGAVLLALIPSLVTGEWQRWLETALIFLVVSCPCALVISVPLSYFGGLGAASRHGVLIKGGNYLEMLACVDTVVFDKTGTLTEGSFHVVSVEPAAAVSREELLGACCAAEGGSNHPIARSIREACEREGLSCPPCEDVEELSGFGVRATVAGKRILVGNAALMQSEGIDVIAPLQIGTVVYVVKERCFLGSVVISDTVKENAAAAIAALRDCGASRIVILTGDREEIAREVAGRLSIDAYRAELLPADKVACVEELLEKTRGALAFVGDGVNDAPVLARADVGIAMGALGSDAAIEAADVVLMDDSPERIAEAISIAVFTKRIVWQNILFALGVKGLFLALSILGLTNMWAATFADVGVAVIAILNAMRTLNYQKKK